MGLEFEEYMLEESDITSLHNRDMLFLLNEAVDREPYEVASRSLEPLSEIEGVVANKMPITAEAIRKISTNIGDAMVSTPSSYFAGTFLDSSQRDLMNAVTQAEVLKFAMLNAMDGLRLQFLREFKEREPDFFKDEVLSFRILPEQKKSPYKSTRPKPVPFTKVEALGDDYVVLHDQADFMVIAKESGKVGKVKLDTPVGLVSVSGIPAGEAYIVGRGEGGKPVPISPEEKSKWLKLPIPDSTLRKKVSDIALSKGVNIENVVKKNFKVPRQAEGILTSIYRAIRSSKSITIPHLRAEDFAKELGDLTMLDFKKIFEKIVEKTTNVKGDMSTQDFSDALFFSGLSTLSGFLGMTRGKAVPPDAPEETGVPPTSTPAARSGGASDKARDARRHSLKNILMHPGVVKGSTDAEREANLAVIDQEGLKNALNRLVGRSVTFTEGTVDRWCELAGIKG